MNRTSYNTIAHLWDQARTSFYGRERDYLDTLLDGLPVPSSILDLGCGTGRPMAEYILARGHHVTGIDQSEELLKRARARLPRAVWLHSSLQGFPFQARYAAVLCWDALFHLERAHHIDVLAGVSRCLNSGGRLMLTVGGSDHPAFTDTMFGERFFYDSHPPEVVLGILRALGFEPLIAEFMNAPTSGRDKGRFAIVARKQA